MVTAGVL
ncbi:unnamed protein product [Clonostachys rhizophaga]|nr:unnamed protein product [Clonostachys rhizophaga]